MSTSILYHGFGIREYNYLKTEYLEGKVFFHVEKKKEKQWCVDCGSKEVIKKGRHERVIRTLPIGSRQVFIATHLNRLLCRECGSLKLEPILFAFPKKHWTKHLGRYVVELLKCMTVFDVARHLDMTWDTVKEIHVWALKKKFKRRKLGGLKYLGVDEIAVKRGHNYLTIVVDLESGQVVWVGKDRNSNSLGDFLERLRRSGAKVRAIAMDMWPAYINATLRYYSNKEIVFDHYHIISDMNKVIDKLRREEFQAQGKTDREIYKGTRYLLLMGRERIEDNIEAKARLDCLLDVNQSLNTAYVLKEKLRELWNCIAYEEAEIYLNNWIKKASSSGISLLIKFAKKLASHRIGILNYFYHRVTTGMVEGINNKIKVLKRQAYGFRDLEYFKLRIYNLHKSRYALIG